MTGSAWAFIGFGAALAALYGVRFAGAAPSASKSAVKTAATAALAASGLPLGAPWMVVAGLALGALGDFFLSRPGNQAFMAGMAAFAAGHLAYAGAFLAVGADALPVLPALLLLALALSTEVWLAPHTGALRWPVRGYVVVITLMAYTALSISADVSGAVIAIAGAGLFILSDLLLALETFVVAAPDTRRGLARLLWPAYWGGQLLILVGLATAFSA
ncbi:hypothetical protein DEA8626_00281 [Defluviimonas aquaemixtae]|uniref:YhhN-like protein n=1 Tax=Albidovulum aquaemixtae TaxID=1542388 RepID=A0A2R8B2L7_9RHOB|nr:lysoplasmalogenase family protein [Defluviimonas aquaemixtae]SPH16770.1 hypothetical protein DEA8626_00281 [Defluviimonas aquaemixtae]